MVNVRDDGGRSTRSGLPSRPETVFIVRTYGAGPLYGPISHYEAAGSLVTVKASWLMSWGTGSWKVHLPSELEAREPLLEAADVYPLTLMAGGFRGPHPAVHTNG